MIEKLFSVFSALSSIKEVIFNSLFLNFVLLQDASPLTNDFTLSWYILERYGSAKILSVKFPSSSISITFSLTQLTLYADLDILNFSLLHSFLLVYFFTYICLISYCCMTASMVYSILWMHITKCWLSN